MTEYKDNIEHSNCTEDSEIDLMEIVAKLWKGRKFILKCCAVGAVLGLIVAFSIPKRYCASAVLAPETDQRMGGSGMSSLASMMGVSLDNSVDAINAGMFPDVVHSVPFIFGLFDLEVSTIDGELSTTLLDYMLEHQRRAWWSYVLGIPGKAAGWFFSLFSEEAPQGDGVLRMENLPERERGVVKYFSEGISVNVDKKTGKTSLSLEMQDPLVAATVMEAVVSNLKDYMCSYRTSKARQDVENLSVICSERKADYYRAQQAWAAYADANKSVVLQSAQAERERLQQEMGLAYQVYSQVATQLEAARLKEQQAKPVFAVIEPVTVPLRKSAPGRARILAGFVFLLGCAGAAWELFGRSAWDSLRGRAS